MRRRNLYGGYGYQPTQSSQRGLVNNGNDVLSPSTGYGGRNPFSPSDRMLLSNRQTANYFSFKVENTSNEAKKAVLFDPSGSYQILTQEINDPAIVLTGLTSNYQLFLNRVARYDLHIQAMQIEVVKGDSTQFSNTIEFMYYRLDYSQPIPDQIIHPNVYRHSGQQNTNLIDYFDYEYIIDQPTSMITTIQPETCVVFNMKIKGEWGRTY